MLSVVYVLRVGQVLVGLLVLVDIGRVIGACRLFVLLAGVGHVLRLLMLFGLLHGSLVLLARVGACVCFATKLLRLLGGRRKLV
jgi:hypothetical protein